MKLLINKYFNEYITNLDKLWINLKELVKNFTKNSKKLDFNYLIQSSSVYSSKIEWNTLDLNSFMNYELSDKVSKNNKEIKEIKDLIKAYKFAKKNILNQENILIVHKKLSKSFLIKTRRWVLRNDKIWVFWKEWLIYLAIEPEYVKSELTLLFKEIDILLNERLDIEEVFYYASLIHLRFAHIHPFFDWNWRTVRLLEKWFIVSKLWNKFWKLNTEEYYWDNRNLYYNNLNLWPNYYCLGYDNSYNFMLMLAKSI